MAATTARSRAKTSTSATTGRRSPSPSPTPDSSGIRCNDMVRGSVPKVKMTLSPQHLPALRGRALHRGVHFARHLQARRRHRHHRSGQVPRQPDVHRRPARTRTCIYFNDSLNIAQKCTFCAHLLGQGLEGHPLRGRLPHRRHCLRRRGRSEGPDCQGRAAASPTLTTKPRVYYLNLPKKFIAGAVFDQASRRVHRRRRCDGHQRRHRREGQGRDRQLRRLLAQQPQRRQVHASPSRRKGTCRRSWVRWTSPRRT